MNNEITMEKQTLLKNISNDIWNQVGLPRDECDTIARLLTEKYAIKEKKAFIASYKVYKTIYADDYEEASEIFDNMSLEDMGDDGEWELEHA